ncbi:hypothetical protein D039_2249B, partial [Vibrio parahaemolyticus EKP-028]
EGTATLANSFLPQSYLVLLFTYILLV